jgi:hypothetical protein
MMQHLPCTIAALFKGAGVTQTGIVCVTAVVRYHLLLQACNLCDSQGAVDQHLIFFCLSRMASATKNEKINSERQNN